MNHSVPLSIKTNAHVTATAHHGAFSRPAHYVAALIPSMLGVAISLIAYGNGPGWYRAAIFGFFLFGLSMPMKLMSGITQIQDKDV